MVTNYYRWSLIAGRIPGRTDNEIKNYWNTHLSKKLISQGIDPRTHKPLNPPKPIDIASSSTTTTTTPPSNNSSKPTTTATTNNNNRQLKRPNHPLPPIINHRKNTPSTPQYHRINDHPLPNPDDHLIIVNQDEGITSDDHHLHLDQYQESQTAGNNNVIGTNNIGYDHAAYDNLNLAAAATDNYSDVSAMDLIRNNNLLTTDNVEDDDDINYCSDDVFSSFLNSLINEDAFAAQNHLQQQPAADGHNNDNIQPPSDA